jgi:hypothetical protein
MIVLLVLYWLVPLSRGAGVTGNQISSDHFERAVDYLGPGHQEIEDFPDLRNIFKMASCLMFRAMTAKSVWMQT